MQRLKVNTCIAWISMARWLQERDFEFKIGFTACKVAALVRISVYLKSCLIYSFHTQLLFIFIFFIYLLLFLFIYHFFVGFLFLYFIWILIIKQKRNIRIKTNYYAYAIIPFQVKSLKVGNKTCTRQINPPSRISLLLPRVNIITCTDIIRPFVLYALHGKIPNDIHFLDFINKSVQCTIKTHCYENFMATLARDYVRVALNYSLYYSLIK